MTTACPIILAFLCTESSSKAKESFFFEAKTQKSGRVQKHQGAIMSGVAELALAPSLTSETSDRHVVTLAQYSLLTISNVPLDLLIEELKTLYGKELKC